MFFKFLDILYKSVLNLNTTQFIIFGVFCFIFVLFGVIYKLAGNHINHLTMAINDLNVTLKDSSKTVSDSVKTLDQNSRREHGKMIELISRIMGRTD